jgi:hypothetical protein
MSDEAQATFYEMIAKAWSDADFKQRLLADPKTALSDMGIEAPEGMENVAIKVVEDTADTIYLVLPPQPAEGELDEGAGGSRYSSRVNILLRATNRYAS